VHQCPGERGTVKAWVDAHGNWTNGGYTVNGAAMEPHLTGSLAEGKSQSGFGVDTNQAVLDAADVADQRGLWDEAGKAKVAASNVVGVTGNGQPTNWINLYRRSSGTVHGCPGNPPP
jgi:hypothetical protein